MHQLFYVFDEHTNVLKECSKLGLKFYDEQNVYKHVTKNIEYILMSPHDCYSGWTITLMAIPCLTYEELIKTIETSKIYDEIIGCIGILLKKHTETFIYYLSKIETKRTKKIKKIILEDIVENSPYVSKMSKLIELCKS